MINEYYLFKDNEKQGPYNHNELMDMGIGIHQMVLSPLAEDWQAASDLPEFDEYFKSAGIYVPVANNVANFGWRLLAYLIDDAVLFIAAVILWSLVVIIVRYTTGSFDTDSNTTDQELMIRLIAVVLWIFYNAAFEATKVQGSIGKVICRLIVVDGNGQRLNFTTALARNLSKIISSFLCSLGFFAMLWSPMKQCWHDQMAKTFVVRKT
ncbi:RDD family protein [Mucilaginibacter sabulilitoris]|uniref:RDD family protein n=1 Tax=Mucilaginibacter sabulilitoris TaxID=1173583 RepID=A0ABZ0TNH2_9SPHI|nr:RDD family protein [Mucilaginibacter sabulilitoris]WPU93065.1 RDD family protein [Mucilaginibacter sabulilitoris]